MAHMKCRCGASMSNVMCPSENIIYVISKQHIDSALAYNADITLMDFITNWDKKTDSKKIFIPEEYDFWYCTKCKRIYQCEIRIGGRSLAVYRPIENNLTVDFSELSGLNELIVFSDIDEDAATEKDSSVKLINFLESLPKTRYFISENNEYIYGYDCNLEKLSFVYQSESLKMNEAENQ